MRLPVAPQRTADKLLGVQTPPRVLTNLMPIILSTLIATIFVPGIYDDALLLPNVISSRHSGEAYIYRA